MQGAIRRSIVTCRVQFAILIGCSTQALHHGFYKNAVANKSISITSASLAATSLRYCCANLCDLPHAFSFFCDLPPPHRFTVQLDSFIHLHLGIDATDLPKDLECHHLIINDLYTDLPAQHNVCIVSIPTGEGTVPSSAPASASSASSALASASASSASALSS